MARFEIGKTYRITNPEEFAWANLKENGLIKEDNTFVCEAIDNDGDCCAPNDATQTIAFLTELRKGYVVPVEEPSSNTMKDEKEYYVVNGMLIEDYEEAVDTAFEDACDAILIVKVVGQLKQKWVRE